LLHSKPLGELFLRDAHECPQFSEHDVLRGDCRGLRAKEHEQTSCGALPVLIGFIWAFAVPIGNRAGADTETTAR
jgi:hypothetical protein